MTLSPKTAVARPTSNTSANVTFTGTISCTKPPAAGAVYVNLTATVPSDWPAVIVPAAMIFKASGDMSYIVKLTVPARTIAGDYIVEVMGKVEYPGGTCSNKIRGTVSVSQYYLLYLNYTEVLRTPSSRWFKIGITNEGNGPANLSLDLENGTRLKMHGLNYTFYPERIEPLLPGQTKRSGLQIEYDRKKLTDNIDHLNVTVTAIDSKKDNIDYSNRTAIEVGLKPDRSYDPLPLYTLLVIMAVCGVFLMLQPTREEMRKKK